jgi:dihydrofolate reductase
VRGSVFVGVSVDGFMARPDGRFDFLPDGGGEEHGYTDFMKSIDAMLIGRKTYEVVLAFPVWAYGKTPVYVLSSKPLAPAPKDAIVERMSGDPREVAAQLDARGVRRAYVDGGETIQAFLRAGLIDRLIVTRVPVLVGEGIPLFGATGRDVALRHVATKAYATGLVKSEYEVIGA